MTCGKWRRSGTGRDVHLGWVDCAHVDAAEGSYRAGTWTAALTSVSGRRRLWCLVLQRRVQRRDDKYALGFLDTPRPRALGRPVRMSPSSRHDGPERAAFLRRFAHWDPPRATRQWSCTLPEVSLFCGELGSMLLNSRTDPLLSAPVRRCHEAMHVTWSSVDEGV